MAIVRCVNGHFYDINKSKECPYCKQREDERSKVQMGMGNIPQFKVQFGNLNEDVTVAMPKNGAEIKLNAQIISAAEGISADKEPVTQGIFKKHLGTACVTGWIVVIKGKERGRDYRICHGINWIGRSQNADICIYGDDKIAPLKHCAVVYDNKENKFFLLRGNGTITYLNGVLLEEPRILHLGDVIEIGSCQFEFIPFCREGHTWEEN